MTGPRIIGHRGESTDYPENTLAALQAAIEAGADGVELDVRFTADEVPVLLHDRDLLRVTGCGALLSETTAAALADLPACEPERFGGERFRELRIPTLAEMAEALRGSQALVFVEMKADALPRHRYPAAVQRVLKECRPLGERLVLISFEAELLRIARSLATPRVGWVVEELDERHRDYADTLSPSYLFTDRDSAGDGRPLWKGPWSWVVYEVNDAEEVRRLEKAGVWGVETASVRRLRGALESKSPAPPPAPPG